MGMLGWQDFAISDGSGIRRKVIGNPNRNGFYYVLDRATGEFLKGTPYAKQTWAKGLDDKATAQSVKYLKERNKKTAVFSDDVKNVRNYGTLVENLGVSQAPAIVLINRRGTASIVEGYIDGPSLAQVVADSR